MGMQDPVDRSHEDQVDHRRVVLVVEDEFLVRWTACEYLRDLGGYRVIEAASVAEAILVLSSGSRVDIVFSDVNLSGEDTGHALAGWLDQHLPALPVLLTSGDTRTAGLVRSAANRSFVGKPYVLADIDRRLKELMSRDGR
jgi:CheY-like chemotaxis protein